MRRLALLLVAAGIVAAAAVVALRWTAPPAATGTALAAAAEIAPADAEGVLAIAQPVRAARWLTSHPQALILLRIAAPTAERALPRLRGFLAAVASKTRRPLSVWWRGGDLAVGATVGAGPANALSRLAALEGLAFRSRRAEGGEVTVAAASSPDLLPGPGAGRPPRSEPGNFAALGRVGSRWWRVRAGRSFLELASGDPPVLPVPSAASIVVTADLAALFSAVAPLAWVSHVSACLLFDTGSWALALPHTALPSDLRRVLSLGGDEPADDPIGARHWRGVLGDLWVLPGPGLALASRPDLLGHLPRNEISGETGVVRGAEIGGVARRVADVVEAIPGFGMRAAALRRAAPVLEALRLARWRLLPQGGRIFFEW